MNSEPPVQVVCLGCGHEYEVSARYSRMVRSGRYEPYCRRCGRWPQNRVRASIVIDDSERRYWLEHFTDSEIAAMACALFDTEYRPDVIASRRAQIGPSLALAASAEP